VRGCSIAGRRTSFPAEELDDELSDEDEKAELSNASPDPLTA